MSKNLLFLPFFLLFSLSARGYIPSYSFLLSSMAKLQGKGGYQIEQELFFKQGVKPFKLKETWWIVGSDQMRLSVSSEQIKNLRLNFIYKRGKKIFRNEKNKIVTKPIPRYHLERPFHLRDAQKIKKLFSLWRVAPFQIPERKEGSGSDPFVSLSRKGGEIHYQIGRKGKKSRVWLKQDEFIIRFWEWNDMERLIAHDYKLYVGGLFFPLHRVFYYEQGEVQLKVKKVQRKNLSKKQINLKLLSKKNHLPETPFFSSARVAVPPARDAVSPSARVTDPAVPPARVADPAVPFSARHQIQVFYQKFR